MSSGNIAILFAGCGALFIVIGAALFIYGLVNRSRATASSAWPQTRGVITSADVNIDRNDSTTFQPRITYDYEVAGRRLSGSRLNFSNKLYYSYQHAAAQLAPYPVGAPVLVYVDPANINSSTLTAGASGTWTMVILGAMMTIIGFFVMAGGLVAALVG